MPIYEYRCSQCQSLFERIEGQRKSARWCPTCGRRTAHRIPSVANAVFKGGGFHVNDYPKTAAAPTTRTKSANIKRGLERVAKRVGKDNVL